MNHSFRVDVAERYGVNAAIIGEYMSFWLSKNAADGRNVHDGRAWTYGSIKSFAKLFPYLSEKAIRTALNKLIDAGILTTGNYNQTPYDRTLWYALTDEGIELFEAQAVDNLENSICRFGKMENSETANQNAPKGEPIPVIEQLTTIKKEVKEKTSDGFEEVWSLYPSKRGKKAAQKAYERSIKGGATHDQVMQGVKAYCGYLEKDRERIRYVLNGSTFFNGERWADDWSDNGGEYGGRRYDDYVF